MQALHLLYSQYTEVRVAACAARRVTASFDQHRRYNSWLKAATRLTHADVAPNLNELPAASATGGAAAAAAAAAAAGGEMT